MTTVNIVFGGTFITDVATATSVQLFKVDRAEQDNHAGAVRVYAGGRRRIITSPATDRTCGLTLHRVVAADVETLRSWRGRMLLIRDFQGWRRWGTFMELQTQAMFQGPLGAPIYTVALTFVESDYTEGV